MARRSGPGPESAKQRGEMEAADELPSAMSPEILLAMTLVTALPIGIGSVGAYWPNAGTALETLQDADASLQLHRMKRALDRAGINLIVEKIEEEEQFIELFDFGIDFGQGYLFGNPRLSREG